MSSIGNIKSELISNISKLFSNSSYSRNISNKSNNYDNNRINGNSDIRGVIKPKSVCAPYIVPDGELAKTRKRKNKTCLKGKCITRKVKLIESVHEDSCLSDEGLMVLVNAWNKTHPTDKIITRKNESEDKTWIKLKTKLRKYLKPDESNAEHKWFDLEFVRQVLGDEKAEEYKDEFYGPEAPDSWKTNINTWLNTRNINDKMEQYEDKYGDFSFYGASPIDFDLKSDSGKCLVNDLCNINLAEHIRKGHKFIGVVFNLDKHDQGGSHWISMFINLPLAEINFWDSYAKPPPQEVNDLINKLINQGKNLKKNKINFKKNINRRRHQFKTSECGMYSCNFIIQQLEGKTFQEVCNNIINDDKMTRKRLEFFSFN